INLWREKSDVRELENWLKIRAQNSEMWWYEWLRLKQSLGTADEIYNELMQKIRENPSNFSLVQKYLQAVSYAIYSSVGLDNVKYKQDVSWLAGVVETNLAYEAYELGAYLKEHNPFVAAKLFEKSLSLTFTQKDLELFRQRAFRFVSIQPVVKNPEKQLRFWTKTVLAQAYQKNNQPHLAQPIVEELTAMDTSDILRDNSFGLAGAVQASSGQRVVESKILQDEAENENSVAYWLNRVSYYSGRKEEEQVWQTFTKVLEKFEYKPNGISASESRLQILRSLKWFGKNHKKNETEDFFRREFSRAIAESDSKYIFTLARIVNDDFDNLLDEFFTNSELLPQILAVRVSWRQEEKYLIEEVMESKKWDAKKRELVWNQLTILARKDIRNRAFSLAEAMTSQNANRDAISLLEECLKIAPEGYEGNLNYKRNDVERELFDAYIKSADWQKAEKMFFGGYRYWSDELSKISIAAAKSAKIADALGLWKINANLDRRNLTGLEELAKTDAKPLLRKFYLEMKKRDPLTEIPDRALRFLQ
ncbi:MAG: hypothetical protein LC768_00565, partial [Acidobacteria bacterium]|nr:hypothetical protein [Acidobacteriota bacterium]